LTAITGLTDTCNASSNEDTGDEDGSESNEMVVVVTDNEEKSRI